MPQTIATPALQPEAPVPQEVPFQTTAVIQAPTAELPTPATESVETSDVQPPSLQATETSYVSLSPLPSEQQAPADAVPPCPVSELPPLSVYDNAQIETSENTDEYETPNMDLEIQEVPIQQQVPVQSEEYRPGYRRPTLDEFEQLERDPFVQRIAAVFRTHVIDARLKEQ